MRYVFDRRNQIRDRFNSPGLLVLLVALGLAMQGCRVTIVGPSSSDSGSSNLDSGGAGPTPTPTPTPVATPTPTPGPVDDFTFMDGTGAAGINYATLGLSYGQSFAVFNSKLYVSWTESDASAIKQIRAAVFNGNLASPGWSFVDGGGASGLNASASKDTYGPDLAVHNSKLYSTWCEVRGGGVNRIVRVAVYNGNDGAPSWSFVDGGDNNSNLINQDTSNSVTECRIITFNGKLYVTWREKNGSPWQVHAAVFNGNDGAPGWTKLTAAGGMNLDMSKMATVPKSVVFDNKLYVFWVEENGSGVGQVRGAVYNGDELSPSWAPVDGANASVGLNKNPAYPAENVYPIVHNSKLYLGSFEENAGGVTQLRVRVYNGNDSSPSWTFVDGNGPDGINRDPTKDLSHAAAVVAGSTLYFTWTEENSSGILQTRLAAYNNDDGSPSWTLVDGGGESGLNKDSSKNSISVGAIEFSSRLFLMWSEDNSITISAGQ